MQAGGVPGAETTAAPAGRGLLRRVATISGWTLVSRVLGLIRDRLWAGALGGSPWLDAFLTAFQLPNLFRNLFGEGALTAAVLPRYVRLREQDPAAAEAFLGLIIRRLALWLSALAGLGMAGAAAVLWWDPSWRITTVALLVVPMVPYLVFICVAAVMGAALQARGHFWIPAFSPVILNLLLISSVCLSAEAEARWLPWAVLLSGVLTVALHLWGLRRHGGIPEPAPGGRTPAAAIGPQFASAAFAAGVFQIGAFIDTQIAYLCIAAPGAVAALYFANRLLQFPLAMIGHGTNTASFPELARAAASGGWPASTAVLRDGAGFLAWWLIPASLGLAACADPLVRTIYQTGAFTDEHVERTVLATRLMALGLVPAALSKYLLRAFQAHEDLRTPLRLSLATVALNVALSLLLVRWWAEAGIAAAGALTAAISCAAYLALLRRRSPTRILPWGAWRRPLLAGTAMTGAVLGLERLWPWHGGGGWLALAHLAAAVGLGAGLYMALAGWRTGLRRPRAESAGSSDGA